MEEDGHSVALKSSGVEIRGDLAPKAAEVLTLAIHEPTTNAVRYGSLSQDGATRCPMIRRPHATADLAGIRILVVEDEYCPAVDAIARFTARDVG